MVDPVEKYQLMKRPKDRNAPDWASKIHLVTSPCYYHNYLMGELLASQMYYYVTEKVLKSTDFKNQSFANKPEAGKFFMEKIFKPGTKYYWDDMIERATGEKLQPSIMLNSLLTKIITLNKKRASPAFFMQDILQQWAFFFPFQML